MAPVRKKKTDARHSPATVKCPTCGGAFRNRFRLNAHLETHKPRKDRKMYQCTHEGCTRTFTTKGNLTQHMMVHEEVRELYPCPMKGCETKVLSQSQLASHLETHKAERKRYFCTEKGCDKSFSCQSNLNFHVRTVHENQQRHHCTKEGCPKSFTSRSHLERHIRTVHKTARRFHCTEEGCTKSFKERSHLERHVQTVHNEKRRLYECSEDGCDKSFKTIEGRQRHIDAKHSENPPRHECPEDGCGMSFTWGGSLKKHQESAHGEPTKEHLAWVEGRRLERVAWLAEKRANGICDATKSCDRLPLEPHSKCLAHLSLIKPWEEALAAAATAEKDNSKKARKGFGSTIMDADDMREILDDGLPLKIDYFDLFRQVKDSVDQPDGTDFIVDVEGSNASAQAYEVSVFRPDNTRILTTVVDWEMETKCLGADGNYIDAKTVTKIYKGGKRTFGMTREDIADKLTAAGMDALSTIFMWGGSLDLRCLKGTLGEFMDFPEESVDCMRLWKSSLPGLPNHQLSTVYSICFPDSDLVYQRHRAEADTKMCLKLNKLFVESVD
ncbi:hypothetical protein PFICI_03172 [Pestalotiopsis fici W106-1]|uniref:C2H2-type domain-containing protein n=1 Tax=Pestalotiopsis fici (strain W106-1 / CGMCC3.15140) TaxID=1229662 RepID=W3XI76_PESFW|nr:uncharacterized protein PFICI_03172 [Pestalotiopsis fici W106-1]ETS85147.1 hypothetical protein PFICI_03172 [Pestalotiopsis fici W106-1]